MRPDLQLRRIPVALGLGRRLYIPAWVLDSGLPGPALLLTAAQHGNEVQGSEALRRFVLLAAEQLRAGRVFAVPFVNLPAIRERRPHVHMRPEQPYEQDGGRNMNRAWPGRPNGHAMQRIAHALYAAFGPHATHAVDLHCWEKHAAPAILLHDLPGLRELARRLGHRFVDMRPVSEKTLVGQLCAAGRTGLTYECAGQYTVDEAQVQGALRVVVNLARLIGLLPGEPDPPDGPVLFSDETASAKVTAPCAGLFVKAPLPLGGRVDAGAVLGHLLTEHDLASLEVRAPAAGYLKTFGVGRPNCDVALPGHHPYVAKGELLATLVWPRTV